MKKLIERIQQSRRNELKKRRAFGGSEWMKTQILRMNYLNQGLVSMSVGR